MHHMMEGNYETYTRTVKRKGEFIEFWYGENYFIGRIRDDGKKKKITTKWVTYQISQGVD